MFSNSILQSSSSTINSPQFMSPISWVQPVPTPLQIWQMKSSMWSQQLVSLGDSTPDCPPSLLHRYAAQWVAVAVAPIMNNLLHLNTEYFHYISFIGIMRAGGKLTAGLCNSMVSTALFSTGLCLGACLSVWSSCVGLDTGVQVKWLLALMESPHLPDVYISSAFCYTWPSYIKQTHQGMWRHFQEQYLHDYRTYHYSDNADLKNLCMQSD